MAEEKWEKWREKLCVQPWRWDRLKSQFKKKTKKEKDDEIIIKKRFEA
jgi:hypothetical protein